MMPHPPRRNDWGDSTDAERLEVIAMEDVELQCHGDGCRLIGGIRLKLLIESYGCVAVSRSFSSSTLL